MHMSNLMTFSLPEKLKQAYKAEILKTIEDKRIARIWEKDASVWTGKDESKWLGWLDIVDEEKQNLERYRGLRSSIEADGLTDVLLMGMGGSSLAPRSLH